MNETVLLRQAGMNRQLTYEADLGLVIHLQVGADGQVSGDGVEQIADGVARRFQLSDSRVQGALLTGTKLYGGGSTQRFEGVFINRTSYESPNDKGFTEFGLGVIGSPIAISGVTVDKFFYRHAR
ncbi:MAG: hypothetical protein ABI556_04565 [Gemmatimonadales bacterium]